MDNTNRFLVVRDSKGEVDTKAFFADSLSEADDLAAGPGERWYVCIILEVKEN
jgi:hypothetical protein